MILLVELCVDACGFISRTDQELSRFLDAARYADFSQKFDLHTLGAGFPELGDAFNGIMQRFRDDYRVNDGRPGR